MLVGASAIVFAKLSAWVYARSVELLAISPYWPLLVTPFVFAFLSWSTRGSFMATRGSDIPQAIAALGIDDPVFRGKLLSLPVAIGKMVLTYFRKPG